MGLPSAYDKRAICHMGLTCDATAFMEGQTGAAIGAGVAGAGMYLHCKAKCPKASGWMIVEAFKMGFSAIAAGFKAIFKTLSIGRSILRGILFGFQDPPLTSMLNFGD